MSNLNFGGLAYRAHSVRIVRLLFSLISGGLLLYTAACPEPIAIHTVLVVLLVETQEYARAASLL